MNEKAAAQKLRDVPGHDVVDVFAFGDSEQMVDELLDLVTAARRPPRLLSAHRHR